LNLSTKCEDLDQKISSSFFHLSKNSKTYEDFLKNTTKVEKYLRELANVIFEEANQDEAHKLV